MVGWVGGSWSAVVLWSVPLPLQGGACGDGGLVVWGVRGVGWRRMDGWGLWWWSEVYYTLFVSLLPAEVRPAESEEGGAQ